MRANKAAAVAIAAHQRVFARIPLRDPEAIRANEVRFVPTVQLHHFVNLFSLWRPAENTPCDFPNLFLLTGMVEVMPFTPRVLNVWIPVIPAINTEAAIRTLECQACSHNL